MKLLLLTSLLLVTLVLGNPTLRESEEPIPDDRIAGGHEIDIDQAPWQISLEFDETHICGGSIISKKYVVTAAHCTNKRRSDKFIVRAGTSYRNCGGQIVHVQAVHQHPSFVYRTIEYDISILELDKPLKFGHHVAPVKLPRKNQTWKPGTKVFVTGWGIEHADDYELPNNLMGVYLSLVSNKDCRDAYYPFRITDSMICAGVRDGSKNACKGDSGGPLTIDGVLGGIVSWGFGCGDEKYPGVYANVAALRGYITYVTGI